MPVVGHETVREQLHGIALEPLRKHAFEGSEIFGLMEDAHPSVATVKHVVGHSSLNGSSSTRHPPSLPQSLHRVNISDLLVHRAAVSTANGFGAHSVSRRSRS